ncbi:hypothetical protein [Nonomuraea sp. NPDC050786]|uniref:hypothetical protein n=1 Tax=Nonomuraea sp. NPDC050786 TaxID=3154840 RepID=UPI0033F850D8
MTRNTRNRSMLALGLISACMLSVSGAAYATSARTGTTDIPKLQTIEDTVYPLDAYKPSPEQVAELTSAMRYSLSDCMSRFGFTNYPKQRVHTVTRPFPKDRQYLFIEPSKAAQYGYAGMPASELSGRPDAVDVKAKPSADEQAVYTGRNQGLYRGVQVPAGGCLGQARRSVLAGMSSDDEWFVTQLEGQAFQQGEADARVTDATARWSTCMARAGHSYANPEAAWEDSRWTARREGGPLTDVEKAVAEADMKCKLEVNYLGVRYTADKEAQERLVAGNGARLKKVTEALRAQLRDAAKVLGD